ncbi:hypothetical protein T492DRAFT_1095920 [Pavlovales sp. CCMP2436]|nr:hypothetical protein T492DRAFT_1095920 [Pavlovales sp. CCMP2436]
MLTPRALPDPPTAHSPLPTDHRPPPDCSLDGARLHLVRAMVDAASECSSPCLPSLAVPASRPLCHGHQDHRHLRLELRRGDSRAGRGHALREGGAAFGGGDGENARAVNGDYHERHWLEDLVWPATGPLLQVPLARAKRHHGRHAGVQRGGTRNG